MALGEVSRPFFQPVDCDQAHERVHSPTTRVVPVRILQFSTSPEPRDEVFLSLYVPGWDLESARQCAKGAVLFCAGDRLWFSSLSDFLGSDGDRGVRVSLCGDEEYSGKREGQLHVRWSCSRTETDGGDWLRDHELLGDRLELALCETLQDVLSSGDESYITEWGYEYDRLRSRV